MSSRLNSLTLEFSFLAADKTVIERPAVNGCCTVTETEATGKGATDVTFIDVDSVGT